ncbi:hypothetical protein BH23PLA1_BH23PLA1_03440 [soil metagenome]
MSLTRWGRFAVPGLSTVLLLVLVSPGKTFGAVGESRTSAETSTFMDVMVARAFQRPPDPMGPDPVEHPMLDRVDRAQFAPTPAPPTPSIPSVRQPPPASWGAPLSSIVTDPPISYGGPPPSRVDDISSRDGPQIPEPMVFDLVRGLGARQGELEINVLSLVPMRPGGGYEWAPEIEYAVFDGFAVEFELPIFGTEIEATKYAAQYTFGTAFDDAFIHGTQGIIFHEIESGKLSYTLLYLAGLRLDRRWSLFGMFGFNAGPQPFPFADDTPRRGTDIITNLTAFYEVHDRLILGLETNMARRVTGSGEFLIMPQFHYDFTENWTLQFGYGYRDDNVLRFGELGFRVIWER